MALEQGGWLVSREIRIEIDLAAVTAAAPAQDEAAELEAVSA